MLKYLTSMGADSSFEKNRLMVTAKNLEAPEEHIIKKILKTFQGEDEETRSQIAFATIIKKVLTSDSNDNWIYLLKNLVILDRVVSDQCFVDEVAELSLPVVEQYNEKNARYSALRTDAIVRNYWKLIKYMAKLTKNRKHITYFPRSQRSEFLNTLSPSEIIAQMESLNECFQMTFALISVASSTKDLSEPAAKQFVGLKKSGLISYLLIQILYKLISFYSSQMLCVNQVVAIMAKDGNMELLSLEEVRKFREQLTRFKQDSVRIIEFVEENKEIKGFQVVNYRELDPMPGNSVIKSIDRYISEKLSREEENHNVHTYISDSQVKLQVRMKPRISGEEMSHQPRKLLRSHRADTPNNPFENYISNFSEDFPQKQIMTIDLIMALKFEKEQGSEADRMSSYDEVISYDERKTCVVNERECIPEHLHFNRPNEEDQQAPAQANVYSCLSSVWNFQ